MALGSRDEQGHRVAVHSRHDDNAVDDSQRTVQPMTQHLGLVSIVVRDYDEAIDFYVNQLGFRLVEDSPLPGQDKRWVVVAPDGSGQAKLLLARADGPDQLARVGNQTGGRVFLFLHTDDCERDYQQYKSAGVVFVRGPVVEPYGTVAVFSDLYGNLWDLIGPAAPNDGSKAQG